MTKNRLKKIYAKNTRQLIITCSFILHASELKSMRYTDCVIQLKQWMLVDSAASIENEVAEM